MLNLIKDLVQKLDNTSPGKLDQNDLQLASATLLVHAAAVDGHKAPEEIITLKQLLVDKFSLSDKEADELIEEAEQKEKHSVDLYNFTSVLTNHLDQDGRKSIVLMLWKVAFADGRIDNYEDHLIRKVSDLIGVSTRDRVLLRQQVENNSTS